MYLENTSKGNIVSNQLKPVFYTENKVSLSVEEIEKMSLPELAQIHANKNKIKKGLNKVEEKILEKLNEGENIDGFSKKSPSVRRVWKKDDDNFNKLLDAIGEENLSKIVNDKNWLLSRLKLKDLKDYVKNATIEELTEEVEGKEKLEYKKKEFPESTGELYLSFNNLKMINNDSMRAQVNYI